MEGDGWSVLDSFVAAVGNGDSVVRANRSFRLVDVGVECDLVEQPPLSDGDPPVVFIPPISFPFEDDESVFVESFCAANLRCELEEDWTPPLERVWGRELDQASLFCLAPSPPTLECDLEIDRRSGEVVGVRTKVVDPQSNAHTSSSLFRQPGKREDFVRGSRKNMPFLPGGIASGGRKKNVEVFDEFPMYVKFCADGSFEEDVSDAVEFHRTKAASLEKFVGKQKAVEIELGSLFEGSVEEKKMEEKKMEEKKMEEKKMEEKKMEEKKMEEKKEEKIVEQSVEQKEQTDGKKIQQRSEKIKSFAVMKRNFDLNKFHELVPEMAIEYPFELDAFQKEAVYHLERHEDVFVSAHTSAGKTVVAEYAIALSRKHMTRTIYTSPIKALSNQKYRDFSEVFGDVGLITGDVQLDPESDCIIMTTEILRSMLYRGADLIRDLEYLVFDECHYLSDPDRGVVWEEVIILIPSHVTLIFLSATVPNTFEFADWVGRTKQKKIFVISTNKRPTPLEHHLWAGSELRKIVNLKGKFLRDGYTEAQALVKERKERKQRNRAKKSGKKNMRVTGAQKRGSEQSQLHDLVHFLSDQDLLPVVVFVYSRKRVEESAYGLTNIDLTSRSEKSKINSFFKSSISRLNADDRSLPQIKRIQILLRTGVGCHHSGLLPIVKEIVEMLFGMGLVKVLFATETFAMGINMPARSVVFNSLRKHDGTQFRDIYPGEYAQAAGRSGRRGIDKVGTVIIACWHEVPDVSLLKKLVVGRAEKMQSQFKLSYNQILNLLRVEDFQPEEMMKRSFSESQAQRDAPRKRLELRNALVELHEMPAKVDECVRGVPEEIEDFFAWTSRSETLKKEQVASLMAIQGASLLVVGRVVRARGYKNNLVLVQKADNKSMCAALDLTRIVLVKVAIASVERLSKRVVKVDAGGILMKQGSAMQEAKILVESEEVRWLDPVEDLKMKDIEFVTRWKKGTELAAKAKTTQCHGCPKMEEHFAWRKTRQDLIDKVRRLEMELSKNNLFLWPDFEARLEVLRELNYIDENDVILLKGRVAREINSCDELVATEMIFEGILSELEPEEAISVLSLLVFEQKTKDPPSVNAAVAHARERIAEVARRLGEVQTAKGVGEASVEGCLASLKPGLMEVVYEWARGSAFSALMQLTDVLEGSIVRNMIRLEETCREIRNAAKIVGDSKLHKNMEEASALIKRDIIFCSSLYLTKK